MRLTFEKTDDFIGWLQVVEYVDQFNAIIGANNVSLEITQNNIEIICTTNKQNKKEILNYILLVKLSTDTFNKLCKEVKYEGDTHSTS